LAEDPSPKKAAQKMKLSAAVARSLREGTLWVLSALALLLLLALLSYHTRDPSFLDTGEPGPVGNWIGPVGAWLAGFFLFLFGRPAYLFPVMLAYAGWLVHQEAALPDARSRINTLLRALGFVLTLVTSCGLATLHWSDAGLPSTAGGVLGNLAGTALARGLSFLGATLLLLGLWLAGVALFLGVSWFEVMDKLGAMVLKAIEWTRSRLEQRRELGEVALATEETAVMRQSVGAEFEAALTEPLDQVPVDLILGQRQVPRRAEIVTFLEIRHPLHPAHSERAFDVVGQHDAGLHSVGPEADVPRVGHLQTVQADPQPIAPIVDERAFARPSRELALRAHLDRSRVQPMTDARRNQTLDRIVGLHPGRRTPIFARQVFFKQVVLGDGL